MLSITAKSTSLRVFTAAWAKVIGMLYSCLVGESASGLVVPADGFPEVGGSLWCRRPTRPLRRVGTRCARASRRLAGGLVLAGVLLQSRLDLGFQRCREVRRARV